MKRFGWKGITLIVLTILVFLWIIRAGIMSSYLSNHLGVPISAARISMWPSQTTIKGFKIFNPRGFKEKRAFGAEKITIDYTFHKLFTDPAEIQQILVQDIFLSVEFANASGSENNWTEIGKHMPSERSGKEIMIDRLVFSNLTIEVRNLVDDPKTYHVDQIEWENLHSKRGFPTEQVVSKLFEEVGLQEYIKEAFDPAGFFEKLFEPL